MSGTVPPVPHVIAEIRTSLPLPSPLHLQQYLLMSALQNRCSLGTVMLCQFQNTR